MISRTALGSLLLALLIPSGIAVWLSGHRDSCSRYLAGDRSMAATQMVDVGTERMEVPCEQWLPRQPLGIQLVCLVEMLTLLVFSLQVIGGVRDRKQRPQMPLGEDD